MEELSINDEIDVMCEGVARGHRGGNGGENGWMDGGTGYKDKFGGKRRVRGERERWMDGQWRDECR